MNHWLQYWRQQTRSVCWSALIRQVERWKRSYASAARFSLPTCQNNLAVFHLIFTDLWLSSEGTRRDSVIFKNNYILPEGKGEEINLGSKINLDWSTHKPAAAVTHFFTFISAADEFIFVSHFISPLQQACQPPASRCSVFETQKERKN